MKNQEFDAASLILAAGRGSRMKGFTGNKALLPLEPGDSPFQGRRPMLVHILENLPRGPKAVVIHHDKEKVRELTKMYPLTYCEQPQLDGTGGALLAAEDFVRAQSCRKVVLTMGDVPLVKKETYRRLIQALRHHSLVLLGFRPPDKKQYGVLEIIDGRVKRIIEWKYWVKFPPEKQADFEICNSGIYAVRGKDLVRHLRFLRSSPHHVRKEIHGRFVTINEYFVTDLVECMSEEGLSVGYALVEDESEVIGVDDLSSLKRVQAAFRESRANL